MTNVFVLFLPHIWFFGSRRLLLLTFSTKINLFGIPEGLSDKKLVMNDSVNCHFGICESEKTILLTQN